MTFSSFFAIALCFLLCGASWALGKHMGQTQARLDLSEKLVSAQTQVTELRERLSQEHSFQSLLADSQSQAAQLESAKHQRLMQTILPINEGLKLLQTSVSSLERQQAAQIGALDEQLKWTRESEDLLRQSTQELTRTLSHAPLRGTWGEAQLRSLVESAGLIEHVHFETQVETAGRSKRPDMIVLLPQDKCIPIDAKVPLDAYLRAQSEDTPLHLDGEDPSDP
ncbi:MAG: DNA recombination protein RmuC, partial [Actinomyces sp.]|nr:DNA recombination protein RmuC [Actinomyces sp.]